MKLYLKLAFTVESNENSSASIQHKNNLRLVHVKDTMNQSKQQEKTSQQRTVLTPTFCMNQRTIKLC